MRNWRCCASRFLHAPPITARRTQGVTLEELRDRWRMELGVLRFIDERFRMGIHIQQPEIDAYYQKTLVPAYEKQKATPPEEAKVADRVEEILVQQRVTSLMDDWLKALRAQGSVRILKPGEAMP
jgi:peptidyl-prolyl cis-trans isomerase SurA